MVYLERVIKHAGIRDFKLIRSFYPSRYSRIIIFEGKLDGNVERFVLKKGAHLTDILKNIDQNDIKKLFKGEFDTLKQVRKTLGVRFPVPEPVYFSEKDMIFITKFVAGDPIKHTLLDGDQIKIDVFSEIGKKLRLFHDKVSSKTRNDTDDFEVLRRLHIPDRLKSTIKNNYSKYVDNKHIKTAYWDISIWNVLVDKNKVTFIDLPPYLQTRSIYYDISFFVNSIYLSYMKLNDIELVRNTHYLNACVEAFLKGYGNDIDRDKLTFYRILSLLRSLQLQQKRTGIKNKVIFFYLRFRFLRLIKQLLKKLRQNNGEFESLELGLKRGKLLSDFICKQTDSKTKTIVDLGCGWGALALSFASKFKKVIALDISQDNVDVVKQRVKESRKKNVSAEIGDALNLPLANNSVDVVNTTGVIEWVGCSSEKMTPRQSQINAILEAHRVLKKNGLLLVGTENRFFPPFWIREPHNHAPLLGLLPFSLANMLSQTFRGKYYFHRLIYNAEIKDLFKGFTTIKTYVSIPHYQHTYEVVEIDRYASIVSACKRARKNALTLKLKLMTYWIQSISYIHLTKLLTPNFIVVAKK